MVFERKCKNYPESTPLCLDCGKRINISESCFHTPLGLNEKSLEDMRASSLRVGELTSMLYLDNSDLAIWRKLGIGPPAIKQSSRTFVYPVAGIRQWALNTTDIPAQFSYSTFKDFRIRLIEHEVRSTERMIKQVYLKTRNSNNVQDDRRPA